MSEQANNHDIFDQGKVSAEVAAKEKTKRDDQLRDMSAVLSTHAGRRVLWRLLEHTSSFASVWNPESARQTDKNIGRQDVGHFLMAEIEAADQEALFTMMKESRGVQ